MPTPFIPFDATDDEIAELKVLRDGVPLDLYSVLKTWIVQVLTQGKSRAGGVLINAGRVTHIQATLRLTLGYDSANAGYFGPVSLNQGLSLHAQKPRRCLHIIDLILATQGWTSIHDRESLQRILDRAMSKYTVVEEDDHHRLGSRVPEGVLAAVEHTVETSGDAGQMLAKAWSYLYRLDPVPTEAYGKAVKAVEIAARPVVVPKQDGATIGHIAGQIADNPKWRVLPLRVLHKDLDHRAMLASMLWTLQNGEHDRHTVDSITFEQAQAAVHLAATLVAWFTAGIITKGDAAE